MPDKETQRLIDKIDKSAERLFEIRLNMETAEMIMYGLGALAGGTLGLLFGPMGAVAGVGAGVVGVKFLMSGVRGS